MRYAPTGKDSYVLSLPSLRPRVVSTGPGQRAEGLPKSKVSQPLLEGTTPESGQGAGELTMPDLTRTLEPATRKKLDTILTNLNWHTDEGTPECNVFTGRAKTTAQDRLLDGKDPDYLLYESVTNTPIAVIEAKRSGGSLKAAQRQAIRDYATPLGINIIFVSDGSITETYDRRTGHPLRIDGEIVTDLLNEKPLLRFVREGTDIRTPEDLVLSK